MTASSLAGAPRFVHDTEQVAPHSWQVRFSLWAQARFA